ncbi:MAG: ribosome biogenesis GTPase Der [Phototrophicaceae bacterium]|jgi:GTP-binding protein
MARKPVLALVGRPNVGKSSLFNRFVGHRLAVTDEIPGTTRDRIQGESDWNGVEFHVIDTGGIEVYQPKGVRDTMPLAEGSADFVPQIRAQALLAIQDADVVVMVVDVRHGITAADEEIAEILRRSKRPVLVAANKTDEHNNKEAAFEFYALGLGEVIAISAIHELGIGDLLDLIIEEFKASPSASEEPDEENLHVAIVGRPNVGKSSTVNHLLGEERVIVSPIAGTTRDAIDTHIRYHGQEITLIDTAGIRKRGKIESGVEKYSVIRSLKALDRAHVALLLLDAVDGITEQDQHIGGYIQESKASAIIVVNKWDAVDKGVSSMNEFREEVAKKFDFLPYAPVLFVSAKTGQRIHTILETVVRVWEGRSVRIPTSELNTIIREALINHAPPPRGTKRLKLYYASQVAVEPPLFLFHVNDKNLVHFTYERYLENQIRLRYPFEGTPMRLSFRSREGNLEDPEL